MIQSKSMRRIPKALKIVLFALGALAGVLVLAALAVLALVDVDSLKPRVTWTRRPAAASSPGAAAAS